MRALILAIFVLVSGVTFAQQTTPYLVFTIEQSRGVDQSVDYASLARFGPWDERNYQMTARDVANLAPDEAELLDPIPAFFRAAYREAHPYMSNKPGQRYPRSAYNSFKMVAKGFMINGQIYRGIERVGDTWKFLENSAHTPNAYQKFLDGESRITNPNDAAESAISINPLNDDIVIAGSNGPGGGQRMHVSTDGGETWALAGALPQGGTCCDPTVGWSTDGLLAYTSTLGNCGFSGCSIWVYRSDDFGQTWSGLENDTPGDPRRELTTAGSDKEYLHVDSFPTSPHIDNLYITWHDGNDLQFARSLDRAVTFEPTISFAADPRGIGSDITTDKQGNVYYFWPAIDNQTIVMRKSTDGGASFDPLVVVSATEGSFDFPIPVMETRRVFIYTSADTDYSNGPFANSIYAAWTDETAGSPTLARIVVARSRDGGATWQTSVPHETVNTVDRFHQWLDVDENGVVHIIYYDTSRSANRQAVDLFYTYSTDGAVSWEEPVRVTSEMSPNISDGFEWGDYNGLDIVGAELIAIYTDNRDESGGSNESVDVYSIGGFGVFGDGYQMSSDPASFSVCTPDSIQSQITLSQVGDFTDDVDLSMNSLPAGFTNPSFNPTTVTVQGTSDFGIDVNPTPGDYQLVIDGSGGGVDNQLTIDVSAFDAVPLATGLVAPAGNATDVGLTPVFMWVADPSAENYTLEVADNPAFTNAISVTTSQTSATLAQPLNPQTQYYWRVTGDNICGTGPVSATQSFTTALLFCSNVIGAIPDNNPAGVSDVISIGQNGTLDDLTVSLLVTHTYIGDLIVSLSHDGTTIDLINRPGNNGCSGDNIDAVFDDASGNPANTGCTTADGLMGTFAPLEPLADFDGQDISGDWTLTISDNAGLDTGDREEWCLTPQFLGGIAVALDGTGTGSVDSAPAGISCPGDCSENFGDGTAVELTATPDQGSTFVGWSGGGCTGTGTCMVTSTAALTTVTATFDLPVFDLNVTLAGNGAGAVDSDIAGIACPADCTEGYDSGTMVTLSATPDASSVFAGWTGGNCSGTGTCQVTMDAATDVTATFDPLVFGLDVALDGTGSGSLASDVAGISCPADCSESYDAGTVVTLTATPDNGFEFAGWTGGGCSGTGTCAVTMNSAQSVTATFNIQMFALNVTVDGVGEGAVSSNPQGIACPGDCSENYAVDTVVTLSAAALPGSSFTGWTGSDCSGTDTCMVTMDAAKSVTATFGNLQFDLTVVLAGDGEGSVSSSPVGIACPGDCVEAFDATTVVTLSATAGADANFDGWSGGGCSGTGDCQVTMTAATSVTASFSSTLVTLTVTSSGDGTGMIVSDPAGIDCGMSCSAGFSADSVVTLTATPDGDSIFGGWSGGGCSGTDDCDVTMSGIQSVDAEFAAKTDDLFADGFEEVE